MHLLNPLHEQDVTKGQFLEKFCNQGLPSHKPDGMLKLKSPSIYPSLEGE